ncbi:MAG: copper chaperone PCu(A)C [Pseudomonadota bacterium]
MRILLPLLLLLATPLAAHEYRVSGITIDHPFAYATQGPTAEGYVILVNEGAADTLFKVTGDDGARLEAPIPLPAGQAAELLPGGLHIDFNALESPWAEGDQIRATLHFEKAGEVPVVFYIEARP